MHTQCRGSRQEELADCCIADSETADVPTAPCNPLAPPVGNTELPRRPIVPSPQIVEWNSVKQSKLYTWEIVLVGFVSLALYSKDTIFSAADYKRDCRLADMIKSRRRADITELVRRGWLDYMDKKGSYRVTKNGFAQARLYKKLMPVKSREMLKKRLS